MFPEFGSAARPPHAEEMTTFDSLGELLDLGIRKFKAEKDARYFFRGECGFFENPLPNIFRNTGTREREKEVFQDALNRVPALFENCPTTFDKLCQMQHYEFPTRIIDVTTDLATAWFMAVAGLREDEVARNANSAASGTFMCPNILVLRVPATREKFVDSDLVSALANVARMNDEFDLWALRHEVRQERMLFGENEDYMKKKIPEDWGHNWMVYPRMSNPRVRRQKGAFILCGLTRENCEVLARGGNAKKSKKDSHTGLTYPKLEWDPEKRVKDEITICGRLVPSRKFFRDVSDAVAAGTSSWRDNERIRKATADFKKKVFGDLEFVGCGCAEMYPDNYKIQSDACREYFGNSRG